MKKLRIGIFDIEANNLYLAVTKGWCLVIVDYYTRKPYVYRPEEMGQAAIDLKKDWDVVVGHNILDYDLPAMSKLYGVDYRGIKTFDTIVASRLLNSDPTYQHSLKAWGERLGCLKGDYGSQEQAWDKFSEAMLEYCEQDVEVSLLLFEYLMKKLKFDIDTFKYPEYTVEPIKNY